MSSEWPEYSLLEIYNVTNGLSKNRKEFGFGYPFLTFKEVFANYFVPEELTSLANTDPKERNKCSIQAGDVFITRTSETFDELGMSCVATKDYPNASFNGFCKRLRPNGTAEIDAQYSAFFFNGPEFRQQVLSLANMSTRASLNNDMLKKLTIKLPPLDVQRGIAKVLTDLHDKIRINNQINQTLEQMAQAIFKSWFVDFEPVKAKIAALKAGGSEEDALLAAMQAISGTSLLDADASAAGAQAALTRLQAEQPEQYAELRATAELFPSAMQDSELGEIPEGWSVTRVGEILDRLKPKRRYTKKQVAPAGSVPVFEQGADILMGFHDDMPGFIATPENPTFIFGDHTCITHLSCQSFDISQNVIPLKGRDRPTIWTFYALQGIQTFQEYRRHWAELIVKEVIYPPTVLCEYFSETVTSLIRLKEQIHKESTSLEEIRDTLLPKLLSGELSVSATEDRLAELANV